MSNAPTLSPDQAARFGTYMVAIATYLCVGCALHQLVIGGPIDWTSPLSIAVLLGWPAVFSLLAFIGSSLRAVLGRGTGGG